MAKLRLRLLGGFHLEHESGEPIALHLRKAEGMLAYLAVAEGHAASRERLATLLWGEFAQARARQSLRQTLLGLTKRLSKIDLPVLRMESQTVSLVADSLAIDVLEFQSLIGDGSMEALAKAKGLYRGDFLEGLSIDAPDFDSWASTMARRYHDLAMRGVTDLLESQEAEGKIDAAIDTAKYALQIDPIREDVHRALMRAFDLKGMRSSAISQFRACREVLDRELGVQPDAETLKLYHEIVEQRRPGPRDGGETDAALLKPQVAEELAESDSPYSDGSDDFLVGRGTELFQLNSLHRKTLEPCCRAVVILGEGGVGKSHLVQAFMRSLKAPEEEILAARARQSERHLPFGLWSDLLDSNLRGKLAEFADALSPPSKSALGQLNGALLEEDDSDLDHTPDRRNLYSGFTELLKLAAERNPRTLTLEDIHWADPDSLKLLVYLTRQLRSHGLFIVATARSDTLAKQPLFESAFSELESEGLLQRIPLAPLNRGEIDELLSQLRAKLDIAQPDPGVDQAIWEICEGNPRVAIQTLLSIPADGDPESPAKVGVPDEIARQTLQQLSRLSDKGKQVVRLASVFGRSVDGGALAKASGLQSDELAAALDELIAANLLAAAEDTYRFLHNRVRLAVYQDISPARRAVMHRAVVSTLCELHAAGLEPVLALLAFHSRAAGDLPSAIGYDVKSALVEISKGYPSAAKALFMGALEDATENCAMEEVRASLAEIHLGLAALAEASEDYESAAASLSAADEILKGAGDARRNARSKAAWARVYSIRGDAETAYYYARSSLSEDARSKTSEVWLLADRFLAQFHLICGTAHKAAGRLRQMQSRSASLGLMREEAESSAALALFHGVLGEFASAEAEGERGVAVAEKSGQELVLSACLQNLALPLAWQGNASGALALLERATEIAQRRGDIFRLYALQVNRGFVLLGSGQTGAADAALDDAKELAARLGTRYLLPYLLSWSAEAALDLGDEDKALSLCREALVMSGECNQPWARSLAHRALARILSQSSTRDLFKAERAIRSAMEEQTALGLRVELAHTALVQAKILRARGNARQSSEAFSGASRRFEEMGMLVEGERARVMAAALKPGMD